jgi:hypothetical protein
MEDVKDLLPSAEDHAFVQSLMVGRSLTWQVPNWIAPLNRHK